MLTLTTIVDSCRQKPDGFTEPIGSNCFIAVVTVSRHVDEDRGEHQQICDPKRLRRGDTAIDHQNYDYE